MAAYRVTFRRHRVLFALPIIISVVFAVWFAVGTPAVYRSSANLWIDNGPVQGSSLDSLSLEEAEASAGELTGPVGPAPIERQTLIGQLAAPAFDLAVGNDSLLPRYLASGGRRGFSPLVLLKHGGASIDYQVAQAVGTHVSTSTAGPQVLHVAYDGPTAAVARSVLTSLIAHLRTAAKIYGSDFAVSEQLFFEQTQAAASRALANAAASESSYKSQHPSATAESDPIFAALSASVKKTSSALSAASAAVASVQQGSAGLNAVIQVIDPPSLPSGPTVSADETALSLLGGLGAGLLMSFLAVVVSTPIDRPWDAELSIASWMRLRWDRHAYAAARRPASRRARRIAGLPHLRRSS
jgi:hypothetical protein